MPPVSFNFRTADGKQAEANYKAVHIFSLCSMHQMKRNARALAHVCDERNSQRFKSVNQTWKLIKSPQFASFLSTLP
jgi:hypothetical protein